MCHCPLLWVALFGQCLICRRFPNTQTDGQNQSIDRPLDIRLGQSECCVHVTKFSKGDCPSEACSGPCFNCGQEEGDCSGVRFLSSFPVKSLLVCGHCTLNSHCAQGVRVQHDHSRARISRHAKQGRMSATLH